LHKERLWNPVPPDLSAVAIQKETAMRKTISALLLLFLFVAQSLLSQTPKPAPADDIVKAAIKAAEQTHKSVFLIFHASWCSWCKRLDAVLENQDIKKIIEKHFVVTRLDVFESGDKVQTLENPGGKKLDIDFGGEQSGLPFFAFLDANGKKIADSNAMPKNENIGYPGSEAEIAAFGRLLRLSAPRMTDAEQSKVLAYLHEKAPH
jgi:thioredoxin-related protein